MAANNPPIYLVDPESDPVIVKVRGRASFQSSHLVKEFFERAMRDGRRRFAVDFSECGGMDSTFLGVLASTAIELRRLVPRGSLVFCRLGPRNLELVRNLGLHRLATVDADPCCAPEASSPGRPLEGQRLSEIEMARLVLEAHQRLVEADPANFGKFRDVIDELQRRVREG
jgi:anti-anti-sigma regulatory factor